jgi:hypothetical protein
VPVVRPEEVRFGAEVGVRESHTIVERRGDVGDQEVEWGQHKNVSDRAEEILLERQAMALVRRSGEPLIEALEDILLKTPAGSHSL